MNCDDCDDLVTVPAEIINFPTEVQNAIDQVIPSHDPLDQAEFNPVDYINSLFPTEQSLSNLDGELVKMESKIKEIDDEIRSVVRGQSNVSMDGRAALEEAQKVIKQLFIQITEIKCKAEQSEETAREITRDIKQLDCAKKNLTAAINMLSHLNILVNGVDSLKKLAKQRQYGEIVMPLQGITVVMDHFACYTDIPKISELSEQVRQIQVSLAKQITEDFHEAFSSKNFTASPQLAEACSIVSILDPKVKKDLLKWFVTIQLNEYTVLFQESEDTAWLDKIDRRYAWFKKHLLQCEDKFGTMFPQNWEVSERITVEFCHITKSELTKIMAKRKNEIDVKILLFAIQKTVGFENLLAKRFTGVTLDEVEPKKTENGDNTSKFTGIISECFQPYYNVYIESLDRNLFELMERAVSDAKADFGKEGIPGDSIGVLNSCGDMFLFFKKCLLQCAQLSTGKAMLDLSLTFQKYLKEYASKVLQNNLPKVGVTSSITNLKRDLRDLSTGLIQNFLKEGDAVRFNKQELARICSILTTAEYCLETTLTLEKTLKDKIDPLLSNKINLSEVQDVFDNVITNCIQLLVQDLELACEPALTVMAKTQWQSIESVGDQNSYVTAITTHLKSTVPLIRDNLSSSRKYFTKFCIKFVSSFIPKFIQSIYKCKPLSTAGAEQLLLDTHTLKTILLGLPLIGSKVNREPPPSFTKVVIKGMTRAEMILKVVMSQTEPDESFVDQFLKLLPESDIHEFQKLLEMKGLRPPDKNHLLTLFRKRQPNLSQAVLNSPKHEISNIRKLNNLIKKNF
ncbi:vacuolar protein sorting-associated protein 53 homolog [Cimex lectularius]|uniref:Vacuolar protein sorting-associated protein 53 homolog n=1 Tax=Cimex lectularius TaxID=79782 RepID=A0A8I6RED8_CIMLE|nr:vacuolar protein sorting-associated protein 53 homolog [Cimex lectularius]